MRGDALVIPADDEDGDIGVSGVSLEPVTSKRNIYIFAGIAAMNSCNLGYDIGVVSTVGPLLEKQTEFSLNDAEVGFFIGAMNVGAILGALLSNVFADKFGRRGLLCPAIFFKFLIF